MAPKAIRAPSPRRRGRPAADANVLTVDRIVDTALAEVEAGREVSMRGLAATLGVDPMALYHHVNGKQALLDAMLDRAFRPMDRLARRRARTTDPLERLQTLSLCYLQCIAPVPQLARRLARGPSSRAHMLFAQLFEAAIGREVARGSIQETARDVLVDFLHGAALGGRKEAQLALHRAWPLLERALGPACDTPEP